ncbi:MAG TPA: GNAT family N-acetyltransferase [Anaerolineae bacterium]|jgi:GNAT superfamily N-acetyltransferase|nr:GNAT family N-acetyltransferase [Anaerolineae bacterium]
MDIAFKIAEISDTDKLLQLIREFYDESGDLIFDDILTPAALERLLMDNSLGYVWLIQQDNTAIAYFIITLGYSLEYYGRDAFIDELYIRADYRGKGLGARVIKLAEDFCRTIGVNALHLEVDRTNTRAQAFYRRAGFKDHDRYLMTKLITQGKAP